MYTGTLKKQASISVKECLSSRIDDLASENEDEQAKSKHFLLPFL